MIFLNLIKFFQIGNIKDKVFCYFNNKKSKKIEERKYYTHSLNYLLVNNTTDFIPDLYTGCSELLSSPLGAAAAAGGAALPPTSPPQAAGPPPASLQQTPQHITDGRRSHMPVAATEHAG